MPEVGRAGARGYLEECGYRGTAPVPIDEYVKSVAAQSITTEQPKEDDLRRAFSDLVVSDEMFATLGPAMTFAYVAAQDLARSAQAAPVQAAA